MDLVHSYEQHSTSEIGVEHDHRQNRVILVNRREPDVYWSANNLPLESKWTHWWPMGSIKFKWCSSSLFKRADATNHDRRLSVFSSNSSSIKSTFCSGPFPTNEWCTSKYTLMSFLPKNLFEQFRRLANFYFLVTAILQIIIPFSPVGPATSLLPLIFVVSTTAVKQAYEDYLRHKLDGEVNGRLCQVLRNKKLIKLRSKDIRVGDFVYVRNNEEIPCDMILIAASGHGDRCYVTTANLDGETSLKTRSCFQIREQIGPIERLDNQLLLVECERPNATLYEFNGYLRAPASPKSYDLLVGDLKQSSKRINLGGKQVQRTPRAQHTSVKSITQTILKRIKHSRTSFAAKKGLQQVDENAKEAVNNQKNIVSTSSVLECYEIPLDITNILLRASRLKNTSFIYGLAVYTGRDTKLAHNSQVKPNKFSSTESKVNMFLIIAFFLLLSLSLVASLRYQRPDHWFFKGLNMRDSYIEIWLAHFLLYNYLVPISLYVTLEFVKFLGSSRVVDDEKMKVKVWRTINNTNELSASKSVSVATAAKESSNIKPHAVAATAAPVGATEQPKGETLTSMSSTKRIQVVEGAKCNSSDLNEDLGQVEVLFSDKTGTLTENNMRFKACSILGNLYRAINEQLYLQPSDLYKAKIPDLARKLARIGSNRHSYLGAQQAQAYLRIKKSKSSSGSLGSDMQGANRPFDHRVVPPLDKLVRVERMEQHENIVEFFICLCLCSTITLNETLELTNCMPDKVTNEYDFQSASPDEESLISAAHLHGVTMCKSNEHECYIVITRSSPPPSTLKPEPGKFKPVVETKNSNEKYIVRHFKRQLVFEFNSIRKRMSVIYQDCDNDCIVMATKGSEELLDCTKLNQLDAKSEHRINVTLSHFEAFAKSGLRTLLVARRVVERREYEQIMAETKQARLAIQDREHLLNKVYRNAENNLKLIGTTAVEDTLQEGVPETIENLRLAGVKVWLLTGDKVETAISVAYLCRLLDREMHLFHLVRQQDVQSCKKLLMAFNQSLELSKSGQAVYALKSFGPAHKQVSPRSRSHKTSGPDNDGQQEKFALIADGRSLHYAMRYAKNELAHLCQECTCVLGCRLSPLQKAEVVDMIKQSDKKPITAAIGDGANDVSMIQEAHVGIGVSGKEGRQAVNSSDFAINRFYMLNRLFFVHGHLFYHRTANLILYFFYKNILFVLPQFIYSFYNLSSGLSLYHPILLIGYNLFFTSLPILIYGLREIHIPEPILETYPTLYQINRRSSQLRLPVFLVWLAIGALQSLVSFYLLYVNWGSHTPFLESGKMGGPNGFAIMLYYSIVLTATIRLYFMAKSHTACLNLSIVFSIITLPLFFYGYSLVDWSFMIEDNSFYGEFQEYMWSPMFWVAIFLATATTILPDIAWCMRNRSIYLKQLSQVQQQHHHGGTNRFLP